jgi:hypothetical protein
MGSDKYGNLFKTDFITKAMQKTPGLTKGGYLTWLMGKDLEGLHINLGWGGNFPTGKHMAGQEGIHTHAFDECLLFSGLDYHNPATLPARIEMKIGENQEKFIFTDPTTVVIPKGIPHSSPVVLEASKDFEFGIIGLDAEHHTKWLSASKPAIPASETKYQHLTKNLNMRDAHRKSGGNADIIAGFGGKTLEGLNLNFTWAFHTGLGEWHPRRDPHFHPYDEILLFVGLDPKNPSYLGGEIEIGIGEEGEKHLINTPTVVVLPGGMIHGPLVTQHVDKPYGFSAICLNGEHITTWLGPDKDIPFRPGST